MVDEFNAGMALAIITMASPVVIYFVLTGLPSATAVNQIFVQPRSEDIGIVTDIQSSPDKSSYMSDIDFKNKNPEQVLRAAYEQSAQSELDRCTSQNSNKDLCNDVMALLIDSCADSSMYVAACDDPRLAYYKAQSLKN